MALRVRSSVVCIHNDKILGFHAEDPTSKSRYFFLPGGKIEENETVAASAVRETLEETGYKIRILSEGAITHEYTFHWEGKTYLTKTTFYPAQLIDPEEAASVVNDASYHRGVDWLPTSKINLFFAYHPDILKSVIECASYLRS